MLSLAIDFINTYLLGPGLCIALLLCGIFLLIRLRPFFITKPRRMMTALTAQSSGGTSPAKAMIVALAGTLGVGNIAGVASAIAIGGAGAIFWMWISCIAAIPVKYAEVVLAVRHRRADKNGQLHGGAHFYISSSGSRPARFFAAFFAVLCIGASLAMGCAVQSNAIAVSIYDTFGLPPLISGILIGALTLAVVSGGIRRISALTVRLIPLMSGIYIMMSLYIIVTNLPLLDDVLAEIVTAACSVEAFGGGIVGFVTSRALRIGVTRGIVSNEAGCGTAPMAHAGANVRHPAEQGVWGIFEVFIDTIVICTLTAFVVLIAEQRGIPLADGGMSAAVSAFSAFIPIAGPILCAAVLIFAFCTIVCWFYYGTESLAYLTCRPVARHVYTLLYSLCALLGCIISDGVVWSLADLSISAMTAVNLTAVLLHSGEIKHETDNYFYRE